MPSERPTIVLREQIHTAWRRARREWPQGADDLARCFEQAVDVDEAWEGLRLLVGGGAERGGVDALRRHRDAARKRRQRGEREAA